METIKAFVDANLIYCLVPMILILIGIEFLCPKRFQTKKALNLIRWIIIAYTVVTLIHFLVRMIVHPDEFAIIKKRAIGAYKISYWIMLLSALILPFTLCIKRLASKFWYVLLIAFLMKIGVYFEHFIIMATSSVDADAILIRINGLSMIVLKAFVLVILVLWLLSKRNSPKTT